MTGLNKEMTVAAAFFGGSDYSKEKNLFPKANVGNVNIVRGNTVYPLLW